MMMILDNYTKHELFAMQDVMDCIDDLLREYVTDDFKRTVGLKELSDQIMLELDRRVEEEDEGRR